MALKLNKRLWGNYIIGFYAGSVSGGTILVVQAITKDGTLFDYLMAIVLILAMFFVFGFMLELLSRKTKFF